MPRQRARVVTLTAAAALTLLVGACGGRARHDDFNSIAGLHFGAVANVMGAAQDTLTAEIWVRNDGREDRFLHGGPCVRASSLRLRAAPVTGINRGKVRWDSDTHADAAAARASERNPPPKGVHGPVCLPILVSQIVRPGDSTRAAVLSIPVRSVLGDSLAPGRYRITARLRAAWDAGDRPAGEVDLRAPRD
jgi:hypothetical protein